MIDVEKLDFSFGDSLVLDGVSFHVAEGECVAFFGPNGGGKTTLLSLLMGFYKPLKGKISVGGSIGYLPQNFSFDPLFPISVGEVISLANPKNIDKPLADVGMLPFKRSSFAALSGGQRQRVLLARALARHPQILVLDEPTANIDSATKAKIYEFLQALKGEVTIIIVTHDLYEARLLADRLFCVKRSVVEIPKEQLCHHFYQGLYHGEER